MLVLIGLGLWNDKDISLRGLEAAKGCDVLYLEDYTSRLFGCSKADLEKLFGKKIESADRKAVESGEVLKPAKKQKVGLLIPGDPMIATTHADLVLRAREQGIKTDIIHNASIMNAIADTGLQMYKFGRSATVTFWKENFRPTSFYDVITDNRERGLHTLLFLDIDAENGNYLTANEAIKTLLAIEGEKKKKAFTADTEILVCCRMGSPQQMIKYGRVKDLEEKDFGKPFHTLIVPGKLHDVEKEFLEGFR